MIRTVKDSMSDLPDEVTPVEGRRLLDQPCQDRFDVSAQEFLACHERGEYPSHWTHDDIVSTEILIPFWGREL